jgi:hypothetical protein
MISSKHNFNEKIAFGVLAIVVTLGLLHRAIGDDAVKFQRVDPNKVPDELAMLADATRANYEKIKTLQGKVSFESMIIYRGAYAADLLKRHAGITVKEPNELAQRADGTTEFKVDLGKNLFLKYMNRPKPMEHIDLDKGIAYPSLEGPYEMTKIIEDKYEIESSPYTREKDGTILSRKAEKRLRQQPGIITDDSDPRIGFNIGRPVWELLSKLSDGLRSYNKGDINSFYNVVLEKEQTAKGVIYHMQLTNPGASQPFEKFTLDGEKGFNPTYIEVKNDKGITISEITTNFNEIGGIFLPSERHVLQYDGDDGHLRRQAKSTFSNMQVNIALPENTFSLNNLGLKNGDKFIDEIANKEFEYKDGKLVELVAKPAKH